MERTETQLARARSEKLLLEEMPDGLLVYDLERGKCHSLNHTATLIWRHCDGKTTVAELATLLRTLDLPADESVIWLALDRLGKAHLLEAPVTPAGEAVSRRSVIRKLALAGGLTMLLPVVTSVVAPTPAMAQSACGWDGAGSKLRAAGRMIPDPACFKKCDDAYVKCVNDFGSPVYCAVGRADCYRACV